MRPLPTWSYTLKMARYAPWLYLLHATLWSVMNLLSLCVFPFAARPMFCAVLQLDADGFAAMIERRRVALAPFFLAALKP